MQKINLMSARPSKNQPCSASECLDFLFQIFVDVKAVVFQDEDMVEA